MLIEVTWFEKDAETGKYILNKRPSSMKQTYPSQVLLCHLYFKSDQTLSTGIEELIQFAREKYASTPLAHGDSEPESDN